MKSIQTKFILLVVVAIVLTELLTSAIGSYSYSCTMEEDADRILQLAAEEKMQELNWSIKNLYTEWSGIGIYRFTKNKVDNAWHHAPLGVTLRVTPKGAWKKWGVMLYLDRKDLCCAFEENGVLYK